MAKRAHSLLAYYRAWRKHFHVVLRNFKHKKVARWTLIVHIIYYVDSLAVATGTHLVTAAACGIALTLEFFAKD